jgi:hypothetical protein
MTSCVCVKKIYKLIIKRKFCTHSILALSVSMQHDCFTYKTFTAEKSNTVIWHDSMSICQLILTHLMLIQIICKNDMMNINFIAVVDRAPTTEAKFVQGSEVLVLMRGTILHLEKNEITLRFLLFIDK